MSRPFDSFAFFRRSNVEQQRTAARPPNLRGNWLSIALCFGAIAIGIIALIGYVLGNASIAALATNGKPVGAVTALALIVLGVGLLALRSPTPAGLLTARRAALGVVVFAAADLLSAALSPSIEEWQMWAARGGVNLHPYPITSFLLIASASALVLDTTRRDFAGHLIASAVLLISIFFLFAYVLKVPSFLDPFTRVAPVVATTMGLALISVAELLARPRGWVVPLLSRTSSGTRSRLLLLTAFVVPFLALALRDLIAGARWFTPEIGLTVIVGVNVFFGAAIVVGAGVILRKREGDRIRLASIVDSSTDAIISESSAGLIESWNSGAERMYGYTAAEAIGRSIAMLAPPELHDQVPLLLGRLVRGERVDAFETVRIAKDGRRIDVRLSLSPILDDDGNVAGVSAIAHDITQRKQEQEALRSSEERLQLAQRAAGIGDFSWDIQNNVTTRSDEMSVLYGLPPGSLGGRHEDWRERIFPDDLPAVEADIQKSLASGELSQYFRVVWPDASVHWLHARGKVFFSDDGTPLRMVGVNLDISERKSAEEAMLRSEARYRTLVENLPQKIMLKDRNSVYVSVNEAYARDLGIEPKAVAGKTDHDFFPGDLAGKYRADDARIMEAGVTEDLEEEYVEGGQRRFVHTVKTPVRDPQGNVTHILVIFWDITEKKLAGEQLEKAMADLEGLNRDLEKSEAALKEAQRVANVGHWEWSTVTGATMWSDEVYRILGIPIGSVTPSREFFLDMIDPDDRRRLEEEVARAMNSSGEGVVDIDLRVTTPAGAALVFSERIFVDHDAAGNVVGLHGTVQDITGRVATERALRQSEAGYRQLFAANPHPMWVYDLETLAFLEVNDAAVAHYGYRRDEFLAMSIEDIRPSEDVPRLLANVSAAGNHLLDTAGTWKHRTKDGAIIDVEITSHVLDYGGKRAELVLAHDITERKRTGEALKRSEAALKEGQRVAQVGHWEWSALTGATTWSDEVYRILGIPIGSATPSYELLLGMIDPEDRRRLEEEIARALGSPSGGDVDIDLGITTPAGAVLVVAERIFVDRDAAGNVVGFHGTLQDITRRIAVEEALRDSKAELAEAQKIANIGSAIVYPETSEIHASDEYFRIFDLQPRPGTPISAFLNRVHEEDRGAVKAALKAAVSSGTFDIEFRIVCGDGSIRFAHGIARKRVGNGRILGLLGTVQDVTERKRTEEALRQHSEILERSNLELERFNRLAVGRELRMIELKRQINDLCAQAGQPAPYVLPEERARAMETS